MFIWWVSSEVYSKTFRCNDLDWIEFILVIRIRTDQQSVYPFEAKQIYLLAEKNRHRQ